MNAAMLANDGKTDAQTDAKIDAKIDVKKAKETQNWPHERPLMCCAVSPCGQFVAAGAQDENLLLWRLDSGEKRLVHGHSSWVGAIAFHPDRRHLLAGDLHGVLRCWDYQALSSAPAGSVTAKPVWETVDAHRWVQAVVPHPNGKLWITAGLEGEIRLWNATDGKAVGEWRGPESELYSLALHPNGQHLLSGDLMGRVQIWNLASGKIERTLEAKPLHTRKEDFLADVGGVRSIAVSPDGALIAVGGMTDAESNTFCPGKPAVLVFEFSSDKLLRTLRPKQKSDGPIKGLAFLADGTIVAQGEHLNAVSSLEFFPPNAAESAHAITRESGYAISLHPDGKRLAVAAFAPNGRGGNGRHAKPDEYVPNKGALVVYQYADL
jgi:WD40 repeat protein